MILFNLGESLSRLGDKITAFLDKNGSNPIFWSITVLVLFIFAYWAIQYLNKK